MSPANSGSTARRPSPSEQSDSTVRARACHGCHRAASEASGAVLGQRALRVHRARRARTCDAASHVRLRHRAVAVPRDLRVPHAGVRDHLGLLLASRHADRKRQMARVITDILLPYVIFESLWVLTKWIVEGRSDVEPHDAVVDAVVPARARHLPPRAPLPRAAALAAAVDRGDLDRRGLPAQPRQHVLARPHAGTAAVLHARLVAARARRGASACGCCAGPWWLVVAAIGGVRVAVGCAHGSSSTAGAR